MDQSTLKWKQIDNLAYISKRRPSCFKRTPKAPARELFEPPKGLKNYPTSASAYDVVDLTKVPCRKYERTGVIYSLLLCSHPSRFVQCISLALSHPQSPFSSELTWVLVQAEPWHPAPHSKGTTHSSCKSYLLVSQK